MSQCSPSSTCPGGNCPGCKNGAVFCDDPRCYPNCPGCNTKTTSNSNWWLGTIILVLLGILLVLAFIIGYSWYNDRKRASEPKKITVNKHVHNVTAVQTQSAVPAVVRSVPVTTYVKSSSMIGSQGELKTPTVVKTPATTYVKTPTVIKTPVTTYVKTPTVVKTPVTTYVKTPTIVKTPVTTYVKTPTVVKTPVTTNIATETFIKAPNGTFVKTGNVVNTPVTTYVNKPATITKPVTTYVDTPATVTKPVTTYVNTPATVTKPVTTYVNTPATVTKPVTTYVDTPATITKPVTTYVDMPVRPAISLPKSTQGLKNSTTETKINATLSDIPVSAFQTRGIPSSTKKYISDLAPEVKVFPETYEDL